LEDQDCTNAQKKTKSPHIPVLGFYCPLAVGFCAATTSGETTTSRGHYLPDVVASKSVMAIDVEDYEMHQPARQQLAAAYENFCKRRVKSSG